MTANQQNKIIQPKLMATQHIICMEQAAKGQKFKNPTERSIPLIHKYNTYVFITILGIYISPRGYHPPNNLCFGTDLFNKIYLLLKLTVPK